MHESSRHVPFMRVHCAVLPTRSLQHHGTPAPQLTDQLCSLVSSSAMSDVSSVTNNSANRCRCRDVTTVSDVRPSQTGRGSRRADSRCSRSCNMRQRLKTRLMSLVPIHVPTPHCICPAWWPSRYTVYRPYAYVAKYTIHHRMIVSCSI